MEKFYQYRLGTRRTKVLWGHWFLGVTLAQRMRKTPTIISKKCSWSGSQYCIYIPYMMLGRSVHYSYKLSTALFQLFLDRCLAKWRDFIDFWRPDEHCTCWVGITPNGVLLILLFPLGSYKKQRAGLGEMAEAGVPRRLEYVGCHAVLSPGLRYIGDPRGVHLAPPDVWNQQCEERTRIDRVHRELPWKSGDLESHLFIGF
jgi:hypothetical protein